MAVKLKALVVQMQSSENIWSSILDSVSNSQSRLPSKNVLLLGQSSSCVVSQLTLSLY